MLFWVLPKNVFSLDDPKPYLQISLQGPKQSLNEVVCVFVRPDETTGSAVVENAMAIQID